MIYYVIKVKSIFNIYTLDEIQRHVEKLTTYDYEYDTPDLLNEYNNQIAIDSLDRETGECKLHCLSNIPKEEWVSESYNAIIHDMFREFITKNIRIDKVYHVLGKSQFVEETSVIYGTFTSKTMATKLKEFKDNLPDYRKYYDEPAEIVEVQLHNETKPDTIDKYTLCEVAIVFYNPYQGKRMWIDCAIDQKYIDDEHVYENKTDICQFTNGTTNIQCTLLTFVSNDIIRDDEEQYNTIGNFVNPKDNYLKCELLPKISKLIEEQFVETEESEGDKSMMINMIKKYLEERAKDPDAQTSDESIVINEWDLK